MNDLKPPFFICMWLYGPKKTNYKESSAGSFFTVEKSDVENLNFYPGLYIQVKGPITSHKKVSAILSSNAQTLKLYREIATKSYNARAKQLAEKIIPEMMKLYGFK